MPPVDLTGQTFGDWTVVAKAPAQNRIRMWTARHVCGTTADLAQTALKAQNVPECFGCRPGGQGSVSHGMHTACGTPHLVGTPCPEAVAVRPESEEIQTRPEAEPPTQMRAAGAVYACPVAECGFSVSGPDTPDARRIAADHSGGHPVENGRTWAFSDAPEDRCPHGSKDPCPDRAQDDQGVICGKAAALEEATPVLGVIRRAMADHPRGLQEAVGCSEVGGCERRLGHRLAFGRSEERDPDSRWRPQVGTFVHSGLAAAFLADNARRGEGARWLVEARVDAPVPGAADLVDLHLGKVHDFKITGDTTRKRAARGDVDESYQVQLDLYALGLTMAGHTIAMVSLVLLPASGSLADAVWYERPHNPARAWAAVARLRSLESKVAAQRVTGQPPGELLADLEIQDDHCPSCPALGEHCAGAPGAHIWPPLDPPWPAYDQAVAALEKAS